MRLYVQLQFTWNFAVRNTFPRKSIVANVCNIFLFSEIRSFTPLTYIAHNSYCYCTYRHYPERLKICFYRQWKLNKMRFNNYENFLGNIGIVLLRNCYNLFVNHGGFSDSWNRILRFIWIMQGNINKSFLSFTMTILTFLDHIYGMIFLTLLSHV